ncbi:MFS transporter [Pararhodobacter aggregans]|uniref:MFS transporter n=1 Tax=Pararhodobacter aggregans TaxID=404875 RepID=A0A2T7USK5_9RHOB|nr:MFS transporter [Pararhodobacter aggregans]PTX03345.1 sugar phosphate permease [Pararhodobacter aggregans]PVE47644.1 MFS transporter [Pararhodobacter aggregans]
MTPAPQAEGRWRMLAILCLGVAGVLATWFSATAILPELVTLWDLDAARTSWLTNAVQLGFVVGAIGASLVNLPDIVPMPRLMAVSAVLAAASNAALLVVGPDGAILARFVTGVALAGVYPPAMKLMATWFVRGRGLALGLLIGALTLGSSMPHLVRALAEGIDWRLVVWVTSGLALAAALVFASMVHEGPSPFARATFDPRQSLSVFTNRPLFLANLGYFGHMWELYALWAWILAFAAAAEAGMQPFPFGSASMLSFVVVASGAVGCLLGGWLSDRIGRCLTCAGMMLISGGCAALIGFFFDGPPLVLALIALLWGITVIGDSAQFSAAVTELAEGAFVGTALALQMGLGFGLTVLAIWALPHFAEWIGGWRWAFLFLVPGPLIGAAAMLALRRLPEATRLAQGAR